MVSWNSYISINWRQSQMVNYNMLRCMGYNQMKSQLLIIFRFHDTIQKTQIHFQTQDHKT